MRFSREILRQILSIQPKFLQNGKANIKIGRAGNAQIQS